MAIDLYETTTADTSHAFNVLLTSVQAITPEPVHTDPERGTVSITRTDDVTVQVALTYDEQGRYTGVQINTVDQKSMPGSWVVWCAMDDLPRLLPATLTGEQS